MCCHLLFFPFTGSYGSTIRYKSVERLKPVGKHSLLGASGEISDFQEIMKYLDELMYVCPSEDSSLLFLFIVIVYISFDGQQFRLSASVGNYLVTSGIQCFINAACMTTCGMMVTPWVPKKCITT